jgi:hypothetical protein
MAALVAKTSRRADGRGAGRAKAGHGLPAGVAEAGAVLIPGAAMTADDQGSSPALVDGSFCFFFQREVLSHCYSLRKRRKKRSSMSAILVRRTTLGNPYANYRDCASIRQDAQ